MLTPIVLFIGLLVATAVIAYWSDNLGKKLGKKRISLFGMRPRDTATFLTVVSSWGIMLFTFAVMLIVTPQLGKALTLFDSISAQNKQLQEARTQLTAQNERIKSELTQRESRLEQVEKRADAASRDAATQSKYAKNARLAASQAIREQQLASQREAAARKSETLAKRGALVAAKRAETARKGQLSAEQQAKLVFADLKNARQQLDQNNQRLKQTRSALSQTESALGAANARLTSAQKRLTTATDKLNFANAELKRIKASAERVYKETVEAYRKTAEAYRQTAAAQRERNLAQAQVDDLKQQQSDLTKQIADLNNLGLQLSADLNQLSTRPVLIAVNQTLVARTLPRGLTPARVESHLRSLLTLANEVGPRLLPNAKVELMQYVQAPDGRLVKLPDAQVFSGAAQFIAASGNEVSVRLVSHSNFAEGEPIIQVRFEVVEVKKAVDAGDVLAQKTIDGKIGDAAIFNSLLALVEVGRREAIRKGINPPQTPDDPNFYENGTNEQIFVALRQIEKSGKPVNVRIVAAEDLSTVEPVRVRFEVS